MAEVIGSMPSAIIGGVSFMLYGMISAIGVRNVVENHVDFTKSRNLIIAGVIFVCGLGFSDGLTFTVAGTSITLTSLAIAAIAGIFLNAILPGNDYHFGKDPKIDANRGLRCLSLALIRCPLFQIIRINQSLLSGYEKSSQS